METTDAVLTVDPGQVIRVGAVFPGEPKRILFSHLAPGEDVAVHDSAFGVEGSKIERLPSGVYRRVIDTRGMRGGDGWWHFQSEDDANPADLQRAKAGRFHVREVPRALLERTTKPVEVIGVVEVSPSPYQTLGRSVKADLSERTLLYLLGIKVAVGLAIWAAS